MSTPLEEYHKELKKRAAENVETPQPCEVDDTVEVSQISGIPEHMTDYPCTGEVIRVEPRGLGTHNIFADWFVKVRFTEEQLDGAVFKGTTELYCVGGTRPLWDEQPIEVVDE
ncbi:hypothetical protein HLRTI_002884 [Halorhabdus tiamatea SARL4B]|uniref:Uncharacterized protein n=1 Tax=Halorhabdus tiamatea SARL4B TaxID=1033806 RepID=U2F424_9EURY|nr:hypothetical protein [Halorhabdus tiamatea]ERJ05085.1 hypothetical protein HLRTI_002884 [Halorhabdus tiamatea SARL4B]